MIEFFWLLVGHSLADYPLQGQYLSDSKRPRRTGLKWWIALTWHSLIHAGFVAGLTGSPTLGILEFASHWLIDYAKCRDAFDDTVDQVLHVGCKGLWAVFT